jgi:uncharacterized secreted repeat protein (TIGR03808 family)
MTLDRRHLLAFSASAGALATTGAAAAPGRTLSALGVDATNVGLRPDSLDDQSRLLQRAIDETAAAHVPLVLPPGTYRAADLTLPAGARLIGVRGATRLVLAGGASLVSATHADHVSLYGLVLDGGSRLLPEDRGLLHLHGGRRVAIEDCVVVNSGRHGIVLREVDGLVARNTIEGAADIALLSVDARGLAITGNNVRRAGNNGILVWRSQAGDDGTLIADNRIEEIFARDGGSGQNGNAINVFRADNVTVRGNRIRGAAFSAVRGNAASNLTIVDNSASGLGEVALYAEFGFEGALIANNTIDDAAIGISVTNFDVGGRLAVVQGNIIRNLKPNRPAGTDPTDPAGIGIGIEADAAVTGNVVESAPTAGIMVGWGRYLRDVTVTANVVRRASIGIGVSVVAGAGAALIANNVIAETVHGAVIGMEWAKPVTGDLCFDQARRFAQLTVAANQAQLP